MITPNDATKTSLPLSLKLTWLTVAGILAGCGGAGEPTSTGQAQTSRSAQAADAPSGPEGYWKPIANEHEAFWVDPNSTVRYGANGQYIERVLSGGAFCTNDQFGGDPAFEVVKGCELWMWTSGAPAPAPTPAPSPAPTPSPATAVTYYFSDCQESAAAGCVPGDNANAGTTPETAKRTLDGIDVNTLAAGSQLLFKRGGAWNWTSTVRLDNPNSSAASPLTFGAFGTGAAPRLRVSSMFGFETGEWNNTTPDGGYVFRGLHFVGLDTAHPEAKAIWLRGTVSDVLIEDVEITNFFIGLYGQGGNDVQRVTVRNSRFVRNKSMGVLGTFNNSLFEGNLFEGNNLGGSGFEHGTYLSNFTNLTLRNNHYLRNSVVNGVCTGGNMTFHGQVDGLLIEGNTIEQDASVNECWLMSITQGYGTAEWFLNVVVRNNRLINGGNTAMNAQSSPGILVENNVVINTNPMAQTAISVGHTDYPNGDVTDGNATVRNNTVCQSGGASGVAVTFLNAPGSTETGNVIVTGSAATTGLCAR